VSPLPELVQRTVSDSMRSPLAKKELDSLLQYLPEMQVLSEEIVQDLECSIGRRVFHGVFGGSVRYSHYTLRATNPWLTIKEFTAYMVNSIS
jgi:hypothetical protein